MQENRRGGGVSWQHNYVSSHLGTSGTDVVEPPQPGRCRRHGPLTCATPSLISLRSETASRHPIEPPSPVTSQETQEGHPRIKPSATTALPEWCSEKVRGWGRQTRWWHRRL
ncbi:hypothetical protein BC628DRAFT_1368519 [Trametes gibbosa]|nr:hypothetical protein BC628DRAFT_1368519 [Trametes gibbosa]